METVRDFSGQNEDLQLIQQCLGGECQAFAGLVDRHKRTVFNLCYRLLGNQEDAEDISQEAFVRLFQNLHKYKIDLKISNWIYTIALNLCRNHLRRKKIVRMISLTHWLQPREEDSIKELPDTGASLEDKLTHRSTLALVQKLALTLSEPLQIPFVLKYFQQLSDEDIAEIQNISINHVRVNIHKAKMQIWKKVKNINS